MKWLKELWRALGRNELPMVTIALVATILTGINLLILDISKELQTLIIFLNGILILLAVDD